MPFIKKERRKIINTKGLDGLDSIQPGDLCYVYYRSMVDKWSDAPKWTTVHELYKIWFSELKLVSDDAIAVQLAWQVFFALHVIPYEQKKQKENGDI